MKRTPGRAIALCSLLLWAALPACGDDDSQGNDNLNANNNGNINANGNANDNANDNGNINDNGNGNANDNGNGNANDNGNSNQNSTPTELVHRVGRFDDSAPTGPQFTWSGSAFLTRLDGSELEVDLDGSANVIFQVVVDGAPTSVFETLGGAQRYVVASGLGAGPHDIEIHRRNEGFFGTVQFVAFVPGAGESLVATPRPFQHRLEFIGDSITCGYGVEGPDPYCNFSGATESAYITYAAIAARDLDAEAHLIAYSGKGVYQNYGGDRTEPMPELYERTLTNDPASTWDFTQWIPEAVVVNLGTNDFSAAIDQLDFVGAYVALLDDIRLAYPQAHIFCVTWLNWGEAHETWVHQAMTQTGDASMTGVSFGIDPADGWGCDYHPSAASHEKLGQQLATTIRTELGW